MGLNGPYEMGRRLSCEMSKVIHIDHQVYRLLKRIRDRLGLKSMSDAVRVLIRHKEGIG